jgi:hypothetical protein
MRSVERSGAESHGEPSIAAHLHMPGNPQLSRQREDRPPCAAGRHVWTPAPRRLRNSNHAFELPAPTCPETIHTPVTRRSASGDEKRRRDYAQGDT